MCDGCKYLIKEITDNPKVLDSCAKILMNNKSGSPIGYCYYGFKIVDIKSDKCEKYK